MSSNAFDQLQREEMDKQDKLERWRAERSEDRKLKLLNPAVLWDCDFDDDNVRERECDE